MSPWSVVSVVVKGTDWKMAQQDFGHSGNQTQTSDLHTGESLLSDG